MNATELHESAMALADEGDRLRNAEKHTEAVRVYRRALEFERRAAVVTTTEPSRGILYRSAAWLALEALDYREGERLALAGLASPGVNPKTAEELREVLERAHALRAGSRS